MSHLKRFGVVAAAFAMLAAGTGTATADNSAQGAQHVPLSSFLRRCDANATGYMPSATRGTGYADISRTGNTVQADVHMIIAAPDIWYGVRLIQTPRPGISCGAGDPGVTMTRLYTDENGTGSVTLQGPVMPGATGAWVSVEGPLGASDLEAPDIRTSDYIARFS
ncbi:MAG TPA: hypothetical protein VFB19_16930 [Mycobacterium sp.]|nr:hypothetical protein [Mycobacterium sp.]